MKKAITLDSEDVKEALADYYNVPRYAVFSQGEYYFVTLDDMKKMITEENKDD